MRPGSTPLKIEDYSERLLDLKMPNLLNSYKILEFTGVRGCGKTSLCLASAQSITHCDEKNIVLPLIQTDPRLALTGVRPHVIDEWADLPGLQEFAYRETSDFGEFLFTSSRRTEESTRHVMTRQSRGARIKMHTLTLAEIGASDRSVSLSGLFRGEFDPRRSTASLGSIASLMYAGGWPQTIGMDSASAHAVASMHIESLLAGEVEAAGRKEATARRVLRAVCSNVGNDFTYDALAGLMAEDGEKVPSRNTVTGYLRTFEELFLVDRIDGWDAPVRAKSHVKIKPRYIPCDASLGPVVCRWRQGDITSDARLFMAGLRALVGHDLQTYAGAISPCHAPRLCYYADADGLAVDYVLLSDDGRWAAFNAEIGEAQIAASIKRLERLKKKVANGGELQGPEFTAVILASTPHSHRDAATGTYIVPVTSLTV